MKREGERNDRVFLPKTAGGKVIKTACIFEETRGKKIWSRSFKMRVSVGGGSGRIGEPEDGGLEAAEEEARAGGPGPQRILSGGIRIEMGVR